MEQKPELPKVEETPETTAQTAPETVPETGEKTLQDVEKTLHEILDYIKETDEAESLERKTLEEDLRSYMNHEMTPAEAVSSDGDMLAILERISENTAMTEERQNVEMASYYGNASIILFVAIIVPIYLAYRVIKSLFGLVRTAMR